MAQFYIKETQACYVTWTYIVEAKDENDALDKYRKGDYGEAVDYAIGANAADDVDHVSIVEIDC